MVSDATSKSYSSSLTTRRAIRSSVPPSVGVRFNTTIPTGHLRVTQSVERDSLNSVVRQYDDSASFRSRGTSPVVSSSSAYRRRYSVSSSSPSGSAGLTTLDRKAVNEIDIDLDHAAPSAAALLRWSRQRTHNDVVYTPDGIRPINSGGLRSRSSSRRRELGNDDAGHVGGSGDADDITRRRTRLAMARSRSRAMSLPRFDSTLSGSQLQPQSVATPVTSRTSLNRASSVTRSPGGVYSSSTAVGSSTSGRPASSYMSEVPIIERGGRGGWDIASFVLHPGEKFVPTDVSISTLPSGQKAVTYTRFSQTGHGDQGSANLEIERVIQRTKRMQETMHTLENFVKRNRTLFPEDIIIYQHIVFYLLDAVELKRLGMLPDAEVYGVKVRERLVAPHGTDVANILKRYYSRHTEVEVEYLEQEDIRRRLRDEMGEEKTEEDETTSRRRRRLRTDVEETTETETAYETLHRRHNRQRQCSSVGPTDRKLYIDEDDTTTKRREVESAPYFTTKLKQKRADAGDMVRLSCSVEGNPSPTVTWYRGNKELIANKRYHFNNTYGLCTLNIASVRKEDEGVYSVKAVNRVGEITTCAELTVDVQEESRVINEQSTRKPWFLIDAQNVTVRVGERAVLEAQVTGRPLPKFKWQKNNVNVDLDQRVRKVSDEMGNIKLILRDVRPSDAGVYVCTAENSEGAAKCSATLRVIDGDQHYELNGYTDTYSVSSSWNRHETTLNITDDYELSAQGRKPKFIELPPSAIELIEGDPLTLRCSVDGDPRPVVTWYKGVRELTYSERHRVLTESDKNYMMQVKSTLQTDPGEYTIVATNSHGYVSFTVHVNVLPRKTEELDLSTDRRHPALREYELIKKMKQGKMPPVFIRKLPIEKTIKVGQTLVIKCCIQEAKMKEYLSGIDIVVKDNVQPVPDFVVSRADETRSESPAAETAPTPDNDAVAVTVLKNVVHVVGDDDVEKPSVDNGDVKNEPIDQDTEAVKVHTSLPTELESEKPLVVHDEQINNDTRPSEIALTPDVPTLCANSTDEQVTVPQPTPAASESVTETDASAAIPASDESVAVVEPSEELALVAADKQSECTDSASELHIPSASAPEIAPVKEPKPALPEKPWESDDDEDEETVEETAVAENCESEPSSEVAGNSLAVPPPDDVARIVPQTEEGSVQATELTPDAKVIAGSAISDEATAADSSSDVVVQASNEAADVVIDSVIPDDGKSVISDEVTVATTCDDVASAVSGTDVEKKRKSKKPKKAESVTKDGEEPEEEEGKKSKKSGKLKKKSKKKDDGDAGIDLADTEQQEN